jgi:hypothetical protein
MRVDLTKVKGEVFYKYIYPVNPQAFLFGNNYEQYASTIGAMFILNSTQWEYILNEWELKERLITSELS